MTPIAVALCLHIGGGAFWVLSSIGIAVTRRAARWLLGVQMSAALIVVLAGIYLWHALHAGRDGPTEHLLAAGTFCAFIGLGLQIGVVAPRLISRADAGRLSGGGLALYRLSAIFLTLAAAAMLVSRRA